MKRSAPILSLAAIIVSGCTSSPGTGAVDAPLFGGTHESRFVVTTDRELGVHELAQMGKVIGPYRALTPAEVRQIEARLRRIIDDLVIDEERQLEAQKAHSPALRKLSKTEIYAEARARVLARLGKELALPVLTSDNRSVVAFGSIQGEAVEVTATAYELDTPPARIQPGGEVTKLDGGKATLISNRTK